MIRYSVAIDGAEALLIEDPDLGLELTDTWVLFTTDEGVALAVPTTKVITIQRCDDPPADVTDGP